MKKRVLSLFMALALCFSLLPTAAFAETVGANTAGAYAVGEDTGGQGKKTDEAVAAVQKLLDALPDEVTEENAADIEAQLMAIDEAMEALSEAQLAMLDMTRYDAICAPLVGLTAEQAAHSSHPICGDKNCKESGHQLPAGESWTAISSAEELKGITKAGYYYLTGPVTTSKWEPVDGVVLCLNGYSISCTDNFLGGTASAICLNNSLTFTLTDCNGSGCGNGIITHESGKNGRGVYVASNSTFNMYGGTITGNTTSAAYDTYQYAGGGVCVYIDGNGNPGTFNMYGGAITGNTGYRGGGVYVCGSSADQKSTFNMYGGTITGNTAKYGAGVCAEKYTEFVMKDAVISGNTAATTGGGVYALDVFTMTDGTITGNTAGSSGGGVFVSEGGNDSSGITIGTFTMTNGSITGNNVESDKSYSGFGGGVMVNTDAIMKISGNVEIRNNWKAGSLSETGSGYVQGSGTASNIFLSGSSSRGQTPVTVTGTLTGSPIGISKSSDSLPSAGKLVKIAVGGDAYTLSGDDIESFTPDAGGDYQVVYQDDGALYLAVAPHEHPICGAAHTDIGDHTGECPVVTWTAWDGTSNIVYDSSNTAYVYLSGNAEREETLEIRDGYTLYLCLNGHSLTKTTEDSNPSFEGVITIYKGAQFTLCDCRGGGKITHAAGVLGRGVRCGDSSDSATFAMFGGEISGNRVGSTSGAGQDGAGVEVHNGEFILYGGRIADNHVEKISNDGGGGVYAHGSGSFTMYGGEISGNTSAGDGGGVSAVAASFTMKGGSITNNTASAGDGGGAALYNDTFELSGGTITGNSATRNGGGVYVGGNGTLQLSGAAAVQNNKINSTDSNIYLSDGRTIRITGRMTGHATVGVTMANMPTPEGAYVVFAEGTGLADADKDSFFVDGDTGTYKLMRSGDKLLLTNGDLHTHPICGATCSHRKADGTYEHEDVIWKPTATLPTGAGYWYLTTNVTISDTWVPADGTFLDLHGCDVTMEAADKAVMQVSSGAAFILCDCAVDNGKITHGTDDTYTGRGVHVKGSFTMYGGEISGNTITEKDQNGAGVYVDGGNASFTMTGSAKITDNHTTYAEPNGASGGGVGVFNGSFTMSGDAEISNNTSTASGAGVFINTDSNSACFIMTDNAKITENEVYSRTGGGGVYINNSTFTMSGNTVISSNQAPFGGGVRVDGAGSTFTMSGNALISENTAADTNSGAGGGVYVAKGTFNMQNGTISNNNANYAGGGVYIGYYGTFNMSGGAITGNNAAQKGGGVYLPENSMTVAGEVTILSNVRGGTKSGSVYTGGSTNNVYLFNTSSADKIIDVKGDLAAGARIGVSTQNGPTDIKSVTIATAATNGWIKEGNFVSDNNFYRVITAADGKTATLAMHEHQWTVEQDTAKENVLKECCTVNGCSTTTGGTLTLDAPTTDYSGTSYTDARVTKKNWHVSTEGCDIAYEQRNADGSFTSIASAPTAWGHYRASITVGSAIAQMEFEIKPLSRLNAGDFAFHPAEDLTYNGQPKLATVTAKDSIAGAIGNITVKYYDVGNNQEVAEPTNVGIYTVTIDVAQGAGYEAESGITDISWTFTITEATITVTPMSGQSKTYGENDPGLTYTATGAVNGETPAFTGTLSRETGRDVGAYAIQIGNLALADNGTFKAGNYTLVLDAEPVYFTINRADYTGTAFKTVKLVKERVNAQTGTLTAADFFPEGQVPAGAAIASVTPDSSTMLTGVTVNAATHELKYRSTAGITAAADEVYNVTIVTQNYMDITATLTFHPEDKVTVTISGLTYADKEYDGSAIVPTGTLAVSGDSVPAGELEVRYEGTGSTVYYSADAPVNAGTYKVAYKVAASNDDYTGEAVYTFTISPKDVKADMIADIPAQGYTGGAIQPAPEVRDGAAVMHPGTDFEFSYDANTNVADGGKVIITGKGNYQGTADKTFDILPKDISGAVIALERDSFAYNGAEQTAVITGVTLAGWSDTITYDIVGGSDRATDASEGITLTIQGSGNYTGTADTIWKITRIDPTPADLDVTPDLSAALTYDGTRKTVTAAVKSGINGMGTVTVKYNGSETAPTDAGVYTVTASVAEGANYNAGELTLGTLTIGKAAAPVLADIPFSCKYTLPGEKTVDVSGLVPGAAGYTMGTAVGETAIISASSVDANGVVRYTLTGSGKTGDTATLPVTITSANYEDAVVKVVITMLARDDQAALRVTGGTTTVYGETLQLGTTGGSGTGKVTYAVTSGTGEAIIDAATGKLTPVKVGTVTVTAVKEGDAEYNDVTSAPVEITITKAVPIGAPKYTKIIGGSRTLKDAALTLEGGTIAIDGTMEWVDETGKLLPDTTIVKANKLYTWRFTPASGNYTVLTGEVELYHRDPSNGGYNYTYYTIKAAVSGNGSISSAGWTSVRAGWDQTFTITPDAGYAVAKVLVDGKSVGAVTSYTFENVAEEHTIEVIFMKANGNPQTGVSVEQSAAGTGR